MVYLEPHMPLEHGFKVRVLEEQQYKMENLNAITVKELKKLIPSKKFDIISKLFKVNTDVFHRLEETVGVDGIEVVLIVKNDVSYYTLETLLFEDYVCLLDELPYGYLEFYIYNYNRYSDNRKSNLKKLLHLSSEVALEILILQSDVLLNEAEQYDIDTSNDKVKKMMKEMNELYTTVKDELKGKKV